MFTRSISFGPFVCSLLVVCSCCALPSFAQTTPVAIGGIQTTTTTGMIGLISGQTARLSVLNLNPVVTSPSTTAPANCNLELKFFDAGGNAVGPSKVVTNFAPQTAVIFDADRQTLNPPGVTATIRGQIRGVVTVNPPLPVAFPGPGFCSVMVTLEIIDNTTQSTVALTTATHSTGISVLPAMLR